MNTATLLAKKHLGHLGSLWLAGLLLLAVSLRGAEPPQTVFFLLDPTDSVALRTNYLKLINASLKAMHPNDRCRVYVGPERVLSLTAKPALVGFQTLHAKAIEGAQRRLIDGLKKPTAPNPPHLLDQLSWATRELGAEPEPKPVLVLLSQGTNLPPLAIDKIYTGEVESIVKDLSALQVLPNLDGQTLLRISTGIEDEALVKILERFWHEIARQSSARHYQPVGFQEAVRVLPEVLRKLRKP